MEFERQAEFLIKQAAVHDEQIQALASAVNRLTTHVHNIDSSLKSFIDETRVAHERYNALHEETERRFQETDRRISDLVTAVGEYIRRTTQS